MSAHESKKLHRLIVWHANFCTAISLEEPPTQYHLPLADLHSTFKFPFGYHMLKNIIFASVVFVCSVVTEPAFAANDIVFEKNHKTIDLNNDGTLSQMNEMQVRLVTEQGAKGTGQVPIPYSESLQSIEVLEAYTLRPDGTRLDVAKDKIFTARLVRALEGINEALKTQPNLLPNNYTGFVAKDNKYYAPIRDAGLATGKLTPVKK